MYTHKLIAAGLVALSPALAAAQAPPTTEPARTVAPPMAPTGPGDEPTPASPIADAPEAGAPPPGTGHGFGIGRPATEAQIAAIDIDVLPDGRGLPDGKGSFPQGQAIYDAKCASCHGEQLEGIKETGAPALIGGRGSLTSPKPVKTVESYWPYASTLMDYMHRAMPLTEPGTLTPDEMYALSAYILGRGGIVPETATLDQASFKDIVMPNADGFVPDPRPDVK